MCALFNFMNRLVEGLGIGADEAYFNAAAGRLSSQAGYSGLRAARDPSGPAATPAPADR